MSLSKAIAKRFQLLFTITFKRVKNLQLLLSQFAIAITILGAIQKRSHEHINKNDTNETRATGFAIAKLEYIKNNKYLHLTPVF